MLACQDNSRGIGENYRNLKAMQIVIEKDLTSSETHPMSHWELRPLNPTGVGAASSSRPSFHLYPSLWTALRFWLNCYVTFRHSYHFFPTSTLFCPQQWGKQTWKVLEVSFPHCKSSYRICWNPLIASQPAVVILFSTHSISCAPCYFPQW